MQRKVLYGIRNTGERPEYPVSIDTPDTLGTPHMGYGGNHPMYPSTTPYGSIPYIQ